MALQIAVLQGGIALGASSAAIYTVPTAKSAWVKRAVFTNTSGSTATLTASVSRAGGSPVVLIAGQSLAAGQAYVAPELASLALDAGDAVNAFAGTAGVVNAVMSGLVQ